MAILDLYAAQEIVGSPGGVSQLDVAVEEGEAPDEVGVYAGVTTLVDAGSTGCDNFAGFPSYVVPKSKTEII